MSNARLRQGFITAVIVIGILIVYGILRYPLIVSEAGLLSLLAPAFMLLLYGVVAITITHQPSQASSDALKSGTTTFGLLVGITFVATILVENFVDLRGQASTISTLGLMLLIFFLFAYTGWHGTNKSSQLSVGIFASIWSAMIGVVIALLFGFVINFLFTQRLEQNLQASAEYLRSGSHDLETFTFWNTLDSAFSHLVEAPIIAAVLGTLGSLIRMGSNQFRSKFTGSQS
jgi:TRAP-type C4-dicarboxylate transport system permease small subunit